MSWVHVTQARAEVKRRAFLCSATTASDARRRSSHVIVISWIKPCALYGWIASHLRTHLGFLQLVLERGQLGAVVVRVTAAAHLRPQPLQLLTQLTDQLGARILTAT